MDDQIVRAFLCSGQPLLPASEMGSRSAQQRELKTKSPQVANCTRAGLRQAYHDGNVVAPGAGKGPICVQQEVVQAPEAGKVVRVQAHHHSQVVHPP